MRIIGRFLSTVVASFVLLCLPIKAAYAKRPTEGQLRSAATQKVQKAEIFYKNGDYQEALRLYQEAYLLVGEPELVLNMGHCYRLLSDEASAQKSYQEVLAERGNPELHQEAQKQLDTPPSAPPSIFPLTYGVNHIKSLSFSSGAFAVASIGLGTISVIKKNNAEEILAEALADDQILGPETREVPQANVDIEDAEEKVKIAAAFAVVSVAFGAASFLYYQKSQKEEEHRLQFMGTPSSVSLSVSF